MNDTLARDVVAGFLLFCRIGTCFMLLPGFSSARVPVNVRLYLALSISFALFPVLSAPIVKLLQTESAPQTIFLVLVEVGIGLLLAGIVRAMFAALETLVTAASFSIGLSSIFAPVDADESLPSIATFIVLCASALIFASDLHLELIRGIVDSYGVLPVGSTIEFGAGLQRLVSAVSESFFLALRIAAAPLAFALLANIAAGLLNRLAPQIQAYFLAAPFVIAGGIYLIYMSLTETMGVFDAALAARILRW